MYSLFLFTSALSYLALAGGARPRRAAALGALGVAILAAVATHPYGALVLASQGVYVAARAHATGCARRSPRSRPSAVARHPVLAHRPRAGRPVRRRRRRRRQKLGGPVDADRRTSWRRAATSPPAGGRRSPVVLVRRRVGLVRWRGAAEARAARRRACSACRSLAFLAARLGGSTSPESRHLIFVLPFFALARRRRRSLRLEARIRPPAVALAGARRRRGRLGLAPDAAALRRRAGVAAGGARRGGRLAGRARAGPTTCSSATTRSSSARGSGTPTSRDVCCRAPTRSSRCDDARARRSRSAAASGSSTRATRTTSTRGRRSALASRARPRTFEARDFGPFLVIRTREPVRTPRRYLASAPARAMLVGKALFIGDADVNCQTVERAARAARAATARRARARPARGSRARSSKAASPAGVSRRRAPRGAAGGGRRRRGGGADGRRRSGTSAARSRRALLVHGRIVDVDAPRLPRRPAARRDRAARAAARRRAPTRRRHAGRPRRPGGERRGLGAALGGGRALRRQARRRRGGRDGAAGLGRAASRSSGPSSRAGTASSSRSSPPTASRTMASDRGVAPDLRAGGARPGLVRGCDHLHLSGYSLLALADRRGRGAAARRALAAGVSVDLSSWSAIRDFGRGAVPRAARGARSRTSCSRTRTRSGSLGGPSPARPGSSSAAPPASRVRRRRAARPLPVEVVDTTGAGDALAAGFLVGGPGARARGGRTLRGAS